MRGGRARARGAERQLPPPTPTPRREFMPESLSLYRSWLGPAGARYEALFGCALLPASG
jgi:hypothetical protein